MPVKCIYHLEWSVNTFRVFMILESTESLILAFII